MANDPQMPVDSARPSAYERWTSSEGVPVYARSAYIPDLSTLDLGPWPRLGGTGAYITHEASNVSNDFYVCEIPPGGALSPERHLYEETIFVLEGRGATAVWRGSEAKQTFEWQAGSLFAIPLNTAHQHFNGQGGRPARFVAVTNAPVVFNLFQNPDFVFHCDYPFADRFSGDLEFFNGDGTQKAGRIWETNYVRDVVNFGLLPWAERGAGGDNMKLELAHNTLRAHISEFPVGTYKKAHRHGPGAHVIILKGQGYSLMWKEGSPIQQYPWKPGSLVIPGNEMFHQHFNTGPEPARYLALRRASTLDLIPNEGKPAIDVKLGGGQIEYQDEDPLVRQWYLEACQKNGVQVHMDAFWQSAG